MKYWLAGLLCLLSLGAFAQSEALQKQLVTGFGSTPEAAIQKAGEIALTNTVGSIIDTEDLIQKRVAIQDGVKTQTKQFSSTVLEASNGSIKKIELLDVSESNGIYQVEALVTVRINDLRTLIQPIVSAKKTISKSVFATAIIAKKQAKDKIDLLTKRISSPILSGVPVQFDIVSIDSMAQDFDHRPNAIKAPNWTRSHGGASNYTAPFFMPLAFQRGANKDTNYFNELESDRNKLSRTIPTDSSTFAITLKSTLAPEFLRDTKKLLNELSVATADYLVGGFDQNGGFSRLGEYRSKQPPKKDSYRQICVTYSYQDMTCYTVDTGSVRSNIEFTPHTYFSANRSRVTDNERDYTYSVYLSLLDDQGTVFFKQPIKYAYGYHDNLGKMPLLSTNYGKRNRHISTARLSSYIIHEAWDLVYLTLPDQALARASSATISVEPAVDFLKHVN